MKKICILFLFLPFFYAQEKNYPSSDTLITQVVISPKMVKMLPGETRYFRFQAFTAENREVPAAFSWRFAGGKLHHDGRFIAGDQAGNYTLEATSPNGIKATAKIIIEELYASDNTPVMLKISPSTIQLQPGQRCKFTFGAYNKSGKKVPAPLQISYGGGTLDNKGNFIAGSKEGKYKFLIIAKNLSAEAKVFIGNIPTSERPVAHIKVFPQRVNLYPQEKTKFSFHARDKFGEEVDCDLSISYGGGKIDTSGKFVAGNVPGEYEFRVTATNGISGSSKIYILGNTQKNNLQNVTIKKDPETKKISIFSITPKFVELNPGEKQNFVFKATNNKGKSIAPQVNIRFSGGKFSSDGTYIAGDRPGWYKITGTTNQGQKTEAKIHILGKEKVSKKPGKLHKIILSPKRKRIHPREQIQYTFKPVDQNGNTVTSSLSWSFRGGRLSAEGLYTAGYGYGQHYVTLTANNGVASTALIAILPVDKGEYIPPVWIELLPRHVKIQPGQSYQFTCRVFNDQEKFLGTNKITWEFLGGTWNPNTMTFTAADNAGDYYLRAIYGKSKYVVARSHVEIK